MTTQKNDNANIAETLVNEAKEFATDYNISAFATGKELADLWCSDVADYQNDPALRASIVADLSRWLGEQQHLADLELAEAEADYREELNTRNDLNNWYNKTR